MAAREPGPEGVVELVDQLLRRAHEAGASDVHLDPQPQGLRVRLRVDGVLTEGDRLPAAIAPNVIARLKVLSGLLTYNSDSPQEGAIDRRAGLPCEVRVSTFPTINGERAVLRLMATSRRLLTLDELGHAADEVDRIRRLLRRPQGLIVVCGPAGSGKTTTLYAMLDYVRAESPGKSIITLEDPVESRIEGITQVQVQPARGMTYGVALRSLLRQDPQVLMIGEVRDAEVAELVVDAALSGHLILTTLHSGSCVEAIIRLRDMGIPAYQLTSTLQAVWAQRVVRRRALEGYAGRTAVGHLVEMTDPLRAAILAGGDKQSLSAADCCPGSLRAAAARLLAEQVTTQEELDRVLGDETS